MICHCRRLLQSAAVIQIGGDPHRLEAVVAEVGGDAGRRRAPADYRLGVRLGSIVHVSFPVPRPIVRNGMAPWDRRAGLRRRDTR
jgi:hypothetical protein